MTDACHHNPALCRCVPWDQDMPGTPVLAVIVTTAGTQAVLLPGMALIPTEQEAMLARSITRALRVFADELEARVALVDAVEAAMGDGSWGGS